MKYVHSICTALSCATALLTGCSFAADAPLDLSTPESTLAGYIDALGRGDTARVEAHLDLRGQRFDLPTPIIVSSYTIKKRIEYGEPEVRDWNSKGIIPEAQIGDFEYHVEEIIDGKVFTFSYNFRKKDQGWVIVSHSVWGDE